jgi:Predicted metal-dependent hydrolase
MNLPDHLIDYVILHELCHTIEKNHGAGFWKLLDKVSGGRAKAFAKEMKNYSTRYF